MRIAVYGAAGMVGSEIVTEAARRGHEVVAVTRSGTQVPGAWAQTGDLGDLEGLRRTAAAVDAVVLSVAPDRQGGSHEVFLDAHRAIAAAGLDARVLVIGGAGALEVDGVPLKDLPGFPAVYKPEAETMAALLEIYRTADRVDWTMAAPAPEIAPGERTGRYTLGLDSPAGPSISAADFAIAVVDELETPRHRTRRFTAAG